MTLNAAEKGALAKGYFEEGCNCCQSLVLAFLPEIGLERETALRMASGLGGGVGRLREICGAVSGSAIVLGFFMGSTDPLDQEKKAALYGEIQRLAESFAAEKGSYLCRELMGLPPGKDEPVPEARTAAYYQRRPCGALIARAAELLAELLNEREKHD